jgi:hypothetical protein
MGASMTHEELRAKIQHYNWVDANDLIQALDAVVDIHKPKHFVGNSEVYCNCSLSMLIPYPCPTIRAIDTILS